LHIHEWHKRFFYYTGVVRTNGVTVPILEFISDRHDINSISKHLLTFKSYCIQKFKTWPLFDNIVTDHSTAIINSILNAWLCIDFFQYLNLSYEWFVKESIPENHIMVKLCCAHYFKNVVKDIKKNFLSVNVRRFYIYVVNKILNATSVKECDLYIKSMFYIGCSPVKFILLERHFNVFHDAEQPVETSFTYCDIDVSNDDECILK